MYNLIHETMHGNLADVLKDYSRVASLTARVFMEDQQIECFSADDAQGTYVLLNAMHMGLQDAAQKAEAMQLEIQRLKDTYEPDELSHHRNKLRRGAEAA